MTTATLLRHTVADDQGHVIATAYWPETWLDSWGLDAIRDRIAA